MGNLINIFNEMKFAIFALLGATQAATLSQLSTYPPSPGYPGSTITAGAIAAFNPHHEHTVSRENASEEARKAAWDVRQKEFADQSKAIAALDAANKARTAKEAKEYAAK